MFFPPISWVLITKYIGNKWWCPNPAAEWTLGDGPEACWTFLNPNTFFTWSPLLEFHVELKKNGAILSAVTDFVICQHHLYLRSGTLLWNENFPAIAYFWHGKIYLKLYNSLMFGDRSWQFYHYLNAFLPRKYFTEQFLCVKLFEWHLLS